MYKSSRTVIPNHRGEQRFEVAPCNSRKATPEELAIFDNIKPEKMANGAQRRGRMKIEAGTSEKSKRGAKNRGKIKDVAKQQT